MHHQVPFEAQAQAVCTFALYAAVACICMKPHNCHRAQLHKRTLCPVIEKIAVNNRLVDLMPAVFVSQ